jgi:hypothetical protein
MKQAFQAGGPHDVQRTYNRITGGGEDEFVDAFRAAASYHLGVVGRAAGLSAPEIITAAGLYNLEQRLGNPKIDTSGPMFNNPQNAVWIHEGIKAHDSGRFFKRTPMNEQGDEASRLAYGDRPDGAAADLGPGRPAQASTGPALPSPATAPPPGLPRHVIDSANYLSASGLPVTLRTMYVANYLGPQRAVDFFNRAGAPAPDPLPLPDAATRQQTRAWVQALRAGASAAPAHPPRRRPPRRRPRTSAPATPQRVTPPIRHRFPARRQAQAARIPTHPRALRRNRSSEANRAARSCAGRGVAASE